VLGMGILAMLITVVLDLIGLAMPSQVVLGLLILVFWFHDIVPVFTFDLSHGLIHLFIHHDWLSIKNLDALERHHFSNCAFRRFWVHFQLCVEVRVSVATANTCVHVQQHRVILALAAHEKKDARCLVLLLDHT